MYSLSIYRIVNVFYRRQLMEYVHVVHCCMFLIIQMPLTTRYVNSDSKQSTNTHIYMFNNVIHK